ncbi:MAG: sulfatase-like hydrolase/transferase [Candidatus Nitrosotenuis sp.]
MSFSDFLPSLALAYIIWSILGLFVAILLWILFNLIKWLCNQIGLRVGIDHILLCVGTLIIFGILSWVSKKLLLQNMHTSFQLKILVITSVSILSVFLTWLLRNKTEKWITSINERLTPLVWIFGLLMIFSLPLVGYHTWFKDTNKKIQAIIKDEASSIKSATDRPNIILVTFDALTARHMSVYGYHRPTTPFIDTWAEKASVFTRAEAGSNYTSPTTASLMTGKRVWTHRRFPQEGATPINSKTENIASLLKENGYFNYAFIQNEIASVEGLGIADSFSFAPKASNLVKVSSIGGFIDKHLEQLFGGKFKVYNWIGQDDFIFNSYLGKLLHKTYITEYPPQIAFNQFLEMIDNNTHRPFFAWIHLFPPHDPYLPPEPFLGTYNPSSEMREKSIQFNFRRHDYRLLQRNSHPQPEELERKVNILRDYYDEFILYCDRQFKDFHEELEKRGLLKNTIVILSSDHGESFEHNYLFHGGPHLYEQVTHIPLIIKEPGQTDRIVIDDVVEQIDIPATILELAGIPAPQWMEGRSLVPFLKGKSLPPKQAFSMSLLQNMTNKTITKGTFALWEGNYKLIHYLENGKSLLFDLSKDPDELNNLFNVDKERGNKMLSLFRNYLEYINREFMKKGYRG